MDANLHVPTMVAEVNEPGITMQSPDQVFVAMIWEWLAKDTETTLQKQSCMHFGRHSWSLPAP